MADWSRHKDGKTHRDPAWPVGRYAPGNYISKCSHCGEFFANMDKRAASCFPCAIEELGRYVGAVNAENEKLRQQVSDLKGAVAAAYCSEDRLEEFETRIALLESDEKDER